MIIANLNLVVNSILFKSLQCKIVFLIVIVFVAFPLNEFNEINNVFEKKCRNFCYNSLQKVIKMMKNIQ